MFARPGRGKASSLSLCHASAESLKSLEKVNVLACTSAGCMPAGVESPVLCRAATAGSRPPLPGARPGRPLRRSWPARSGYLPGQAVAVQAGDRAAVSAGEPGVAAHCASCLCGVWFRTVPQSDRISFCGTLSPPADGVVATIYASAKLAPLPIGISWCQILA